MKNKLIDLNDHLFAQMERLGDEGLSTEELKDEISRSKAMTSISNQIVSNATLALEAKKFQVEWQGTKHSELPPMIEGVKNA